jgi:Ni/Co efflux regulator RcnB
VLYSNSSAAKNSALQNATVHNRWLKNTASGAGFKQSRRSKAKTWEQMQKRGALAREGGIMNRLKIFVIGAALATGGSALASAQALKQNVAYHDRDRDRDHDRDRDRDRDRRYYRDYDRDDRRYYRSYDYDRYDRGYYGKRRWDGRNWWYWNGREWVR